MSERRIYFKEKEVKNRKTNNLDIETIIREEIISGEKAMFIEVLMMY